MKNLFTLFMALCLSVSAFAQEPVQRSLITKRTASWCGNCGTWGWAFFDGLIEDNQGKATFIAAHSSGDLVTDLSKEFTDQFGASGQPNFFFGENRINVGSSSYPDQQAMLKTIIDEKFNETPIANTEIAFGDTVDGKIEMTARTKFFQEAEGDFYLSIFALEDGVINSQAGQGGNASHKKVFRAAASTNVFGEQIANGQVAADEEFLTPFLIDLDPSWEVSNISVAFIIWNKVGDEYVFVNTFDTNEIFSIASATKQQLDKGAYSLTSNLVSGSTQLTIGSNDVLGNATVQLVDMKGSIVKTVWDANINSETAIQIDDHGIAPGTYLISIQIENKVASEKIVFLR